MAGNLLKTAKQNLHIINIILLAVILFLISDFIPEAAMLGFFLVPYFFISYKWDLSILERVLLSLPLAALSLNMLYLLSVFSIPLPSFFIYAIIFGLPLAISLVFYREKIIKDARRAGELSKSLSLFFMLFLILASIFAYQGFLTSKYIPRTDAMEYLAKSQFVRNSIQFHQAIFSWYDKQQLGYPVFTFDPYLSFLLQGFYLFITAGQFAKIFNFSFLAFMVFMTLGVFLLSRQLLKNDAWAFVVSLIFIANPAMALNSAFVGNYKLFAAYAAMPVTLYFIIKSLEQCASKPVSSLEVPSLVNKTQDSGHKTLLAQSSVLTALLFSYILLSHSSIALVLLVFLAFITLANHIRQNGIKFDSKMAPIALHTGKTIALFLLFTSFFIIPVFVYSQYTSKITFELGSINIYETLIKPLFTEPTISPDNVNFDSGIFYGVLLLLSFVVFVYDFYRNVKNDALVFAVVFLASWAILLAAAANISIISRTLVGIDRMVPFFALFYAVSIGNGFSRLFEYTKNNQIAQIFLGLVLLAFILHYLDITHQRTYGTEDAIGYVGEDGLYVELVQYGDFTQKTFGNIEGRMTTYGLYGTSIHPLFALAHNTSTNGLGFVQGQHTDIYLSRLTEIYKKKWGLPDSTTPEEAMKLFRMTHTTALFVDSCKEGGESAIKRFQDCDSCEFDSAKQITDCEFLITLSSPFAEGSSIPITEKNYYSVQREAVASERLNPEEILIKHPAPHYLLVKEEYFPNWHAYQNGIELPVTESDIGLMIIENRGGSDILMKYELPLWEKILFLIGIGSLVLLIYYPTSDQE